MATEITHILVVDDDKRLRALIAKLLKEQGYYVSTAEDGNQALERLATFSVDLIVLDVMMPGKTGIEMTAELRENNYHVPILMLTAMGESHDRIKGLESGADDYLGKPFEPKELVLRIESILRRFRMVIAALDDNKENIVVLGSWQFDVDAMRLTDDDGNVVSLTSTELKILHMMVVHKGQAVSRAAIAEMLNKEGGKPVNERTVDVQVTRLRQKIEPDPKKPLFLQTIRGEGYVLRG